MGLILIGIAILLTILIVFALIQAAGMVSRREEKEYED